MEKRRYLAAVVLSTAALTSLGVSIAHAHSLGYSSVRNGDVRYQDKTDFDTERTYEIGQWNPLGSVDFLPDEWNTAEDLEIRDVDDCSNSWYGWYTHTSIGADDVIMNKCALRNVSSTYRDKVEHQTMGEELGHALGIDHSACGNLVDPSCSLSSKVKTVQPHDKCDYRSLWGTPC